jgi:hypothetical protein
MPLSPLLVEMQLMGNSFTGSLPDAWSSLNQLTLLAAHDNRLTGTLPVAWSSMAVSDV